MKSLLGKPITILFLGAVLLLITACTTTDDYGVGVDKKQPTRLANPRG